MKGKASKADAPFAKRERKKERERKNAIRYLN